jgi:uncharacterized protein
MTPGSSPTRAADAPRTNASPDRGAAAARVLLRPIANPLALGFAGLAGASLVTSGLELGWIASSERDQVGLLMILFAPPLQGTASIFGFVGRDVVAATGMGILSATWLCTGAVLLATPPGATSDALGTFLVLAGAALAVVASAGARSKLLPATVMGVAALRLAVMGVYELAAGAPWRTAAGVLGVALSGLALVAVAALTWEDVLKRSSALTVRRGRGRTALEAPLEEQVRGVAREAGVREQL